MVNIVEPSLKILTDIDSTKVLKLIESCGRTCYQSYENETEDCTSAKKMIAMLIKSGHESVLEHFSISIKMNVDVGCYDDKTYVLTENGWKLFKDLQPNEKVYTKKDNGEVLLVPFLSKIEKDWDGILHHYHSTQVNLKVTPDHNMWVFDTNKRSSKTKIWKFLESQQLTNKSYSFDKSTDKTKKDINRIIHIPSVYRQCGFYTKEFNGHAFNNLDFFELLGWWITDGSLERVRNHFCITLHQSKEQGRKRIEYLLKNMNLPYNLYKNRYRIKSVALADYIKDMFYYNKNNETGYKKSYDIAISPFIRNAYTNEIEAFLKGVLGGDGSVYADGRKIIYTASKQFALDLIELCFKCGMTANYYMSNTTGYPCSYKNNGAVYVVSICRTEKHWFDKTQKNYTEEYYKGKVYCVELEEHHKLFVMREGKTCWCGNCYKDLTRHRAGTAYSIESTRFCNYNKDKFGSELTFINPCNINYGTDEYTIWEQCMRSIETYYNMMAKFNCKADQLRMILPHSTAAEVSMTANLRAWRHIFKMRCHKAAHPSVRQIMLATLKQFHQKLPVIFDDIYETYKDDMNLAERVIYND